MAHLTEVVLKPLITEKVSKETEDSNRYGFIVNKAASKNQIKNAIESHYDVKVVKVNTMVMAGKTKRTAKGYKKLPGIKKALVELANGQKIEFFKGI